MKVGRNDPCPCNSGKKYKKCCLRNDTMVPSKLDITFLRDYQSDFSYIESSARVISTIIEKYAYPDVGIAIFCLNLWRQNRSALAQGQSLNMALCLCNTFGNQRIQSYADLSSFYDEVSPHLSITCYEDYIIDDYGEVFLNHAGKSYPIIIGTGHQQVYGALRYLQTLVTNTKRDLEFVTILVYLKMLIDATCETNAPNRDLEIKHELPSEEFWDTIKTLFNTPLFCTQYAAVSQIMGHNYGPIEMRHFVKYENKILPLCNLSILIDYYKILLNSIRAQENETHIVQTIHALVENTFNFSPKTPNRVLISPMVLDRETGDRNVTDGIIFAGFGKHNLLIAINSSSQIQEIIKSINALNKSNGIRLLEPHYRQECNGVYGVDVDPNYDITYMVVEPFSDIASHATWLEDGSNEFSCTALDALYMIGFSDNLSEVIDFIRYDKEDHTEIFSFGGKSNYFLAWKSANRHISSGAIEYNHISLDYNTAEDYTYAYFSNNLCDFPRSGKGLFIDPLNWRAEKSSFGYTQIYHKGCRGFGGEIKRLANDIHVFLAHNVDFFTEQDFEPAAHTALKTIDELNERLFLRYSEALSKFGSLSGRTLQLLYMPWTYAKRKHANTFLSDSSKSIVFCDGLLQQDSFIIRYSADYDILLSAIQNSPDRRSENTYFMELLQPISKFSSSEYKMLCDQLCADSHLKKTVDVFHIEQYYYYSDRSLDTTIPVVSFIRARKEIAKTCLTSGVEPGEYQGKAATSAIRKMQLSVVRIFENYLTNYDQFDLHKKILGYYAVQQNGIIVNIKRYAAFSDLDDEVQLEFEQSTRNIREEYRRKVETAKYLLESNLAVPHFTDAPECSDDDFSFLIAFADWLVTLQDSADICHYSEFDLSICIDDEYRVNTILSEETRVRNEDMLLRKYSTKDYLIKNDDVDLEYFERAIAAFNQDTGIDLALLISLIEYMQLGIVDDGIATEIFPNVFEVDKSLLAEKYNAILEHPVSDLDSIFQLVNFLTLDPALLKTANSIQHDLLPIWEREKRDNRFSTKPIILHAEKCIFSPVAMNHVLTSWKSGITEWYLPYEIGLTSLVSLLKQWKKRYEDEMVQDIAQLFRNAGFDLVVPELELIYRFPNAGFPEELGDYDVFAINKITHEIWIVESKVLQKVGSIYEDQMQQKSFFFQHKDDERFQRRINYMMNSYADVLNAFNIDVEEYTIIPYMVTNKLFASRYKKIAFPIIVFDELHKILEQYCSNG